MCCLIHLKGINVSQPVLHVAVHHQFAETQHLSAEMEGIPKSGLLSFLRNGDIKQRSVNVGKYNSNVPSKQVVAPF